MPTQKKGCDDDEIVGLFSPQRRLFRKSKAAVLFRAMVSYRLMYILHESAMTPTHSSLGTLKSLERACALLEGSGQEMIDACAVKDKPAKTIDKVVRWICSNIVQETSCT